MSAIKSEVFSALFIVGIIAATIGAAYFSAGKEIDLVIIGVIAAVMLIICFFNVRLSLMLLILSMLLSPEIMIGSTSSRDITIRFDDIFLLIMTFGWIVRIAVFKNIGLMLKNPMNRPIYAFSLSAILSTTLGAFYGTVSPMTGFFFVLKFIEYFFLFSIIVNFIKDYKEVNQLLTTMFIVCAIICLYGLYQTVTGGDVSAPFEGSEGEKNTLGGYLVLMVSVAIGVIIHSESRREKLLLILMVTAAGIVILNSMSRSSWVAIAVAAFLYFFIIKQKLAYLAAVALAAGLLVVYMPEEVVERFMYTFTQEWAPHRKFVTIAGVRLDTSLSGRIFDYLNALRRWPEHPILGFGVTGFAFLDGQFFRVLIEMGAVGLIVIIWLFARLHKLIVQAMKASLSPRLHGMTVGFYVGFWAMMAHALSANTFIIVRIAEPFWCLAGLTVICMMHAQETEEWIHKEPEQPQDQEYLSYKDLTRRSHSARQS